MSWWYGDYSALLYEFVRGEEVKGMKKIDAKEMRTVEGGGMWYTTKCGGYSLVLLSKLTERIERTVAI